jgi:hypothetical protein
MNALFSFSVIIPKKIPHFNGFRFISYNPTGNVLQSKRENGSFPCSVFPQMKVLA